MKRFINWLSSKISPRKASTNSPPLSATGKLYRTGDLGRLRADLDTNDVGNDRQEAVHG